MNKENNSPGQRWNRRSFLAGVACAMAAAGCATSGNRKQISAIDCHTHFYDPSRPEGVPWPPKNDQKLYRRVMPADYKALARPLGISGTVVVEASDRISDNDWLLKLGEADRFILGVVGNLPVGTDGFAHHLNRLALHPLFKGIRVRDAAVSHLNQQSVLRDLRSLADHNLTLDVNGGSASLPAIARLANQIPELRIMVNHVANVNIDNGPLPDAWVDGLALTASRPNVYCKVSGLVEGAQERGAGAHDGKLYQPVLDHVWDCFGERRLVFGSNWPVSERFADLRAVLQTVTRYFETKGGAALQNVLVENSRRFYRWNLA